MNQLDENNEFIDRGENVSPTLEDPLAKFFHFAADLLRISLPL